MIRPFRIIAGILGVLAVTTLSHAQVSASKTYALTATIPAATGINIVATQVDSTTDPDTFGAQVNSFNFDPLVFDTAFGIWKSNVYFAIDIGAVGGAGSPTVTFTYNDTAIPAGQPKGLGFHATATFVKVTGLAPNQVETSIPGKGTKLLKDVSGLVVTPGETAGGFGRTYVGLYDGNTPALTAAGGAPFTNSNVAGGYGGNFLVSATIP